MRVIEQRRSFFFGVAIVTILLLVEAFSPADHNGKPPSQSTTSTSKQSNQPITATHPFTTRESVIGPAPHRRHQKKTARESSTVLDWEQRTELERRVDDGSHYDHFMDFYCRDSTKNAATKDGGAYDKKPNREDDDDPSTPTLPGIFCGYRFTEDERERLRSAHAVDND